MTPTDPEPKGGHMTGPQKKLLARINRCPKGYALNPKEDVTARILYREGKIELVGITAWPKKAS